MMRCRQACLRPKCLYVHHGHPRTVARSQMIPRPSSCPSCSSCSSYSSCPFCSSSPSCPSCSTTGRASSPSSTTSCGHERRTTSSCDDDPTREKRRRNRRNNHYCHCRCSCHYRCHCHYHCRSRRSGAACETTTCDCCDRDHDCDCVSDCDYGCDYECGCDLCYGATSFGRVCVIAIGCGSECARGALHRCCCCCWQRRCCSRAGPTQPRELPRRRSASPPSESHLRLHSSLRCHSAVCEVCALVCSASNGRLLCLCGPELSLPQLRCFKWLQERRKRSKRVENVRDGNFHVVFTSCVPVCPISSSSSSLRVRDWAVRAATLDALASLLEGKHDRTRADDRRTHTHTADASGQAGTPNPHACPCLSVSACLARLRGPPPLPAAASPRRESSAVVVSLVRLRHRPTHRQPPTMPSTSMQVSLTMMRGCIPISPRVRVRCRPCRINFACRPTPLPSFTSTIKPASTASSAR